jgi:hypothetical protein
VKLEELKEFIGAADLYITPYLNEAQITSGTLAYTFGAGKAVISTPYWHAAELLAEGRGVLVPFGDAPAIAREVIGLLRDETRRHAMRKNTYKLGRDMIWSNVARMYMGAFERARIEGAVLSRKSFATKTLDEAPRQFPELKLDHLSRITDSTGIFQHAIFTVPNFSEGYCTDDNTRAFILAVLLDVLKEEPVRMRTLATTYAAFLHHAFDSKTKRFHNHLSFDRRWIDEQGSEDCHARALWALGLGAGRSPYRSFQVMAGQLFAQALPAVTRFTSPRAWAFALMGIHEYLRRLNGDRTVNQIRETLTTLLMGLFDRTAQPDWPWFEEELTYDNSKLAHALILRGSSTGQPAVLERGLMTLRWLAEVQTSEHGHLRPIGSNGFYRRGGTRVLFDQQPFEAHAMVSASLAAYRVTSEPWWFEQAQRAFERPRCSIPPSCRIRISRICRRAREQETADVARKVIILAQSNYEVQFAPDSNLSERVLFPTTPSQSNGIEDARFVLFQNEDGTKTYYATYTAYDSRMILPQFIQTPDFLHFKFITLNGPAVQNKGMALFPRKIHGRYAMLCSQDYENIYVMFSDHLHFWHSAQLTPQPKFPWEFIMKMSAKAMCPTSFTPAEASCTAGSLSSRTRCPTPPPRSPRCRSTTCWRRWNSSAPICPVPSSTVGLHPIEKETVIA